MSSAARRCQLACVLAAWKEAAACLAATRQLVVGVQRQAQRRAVLSAFRSWQDETSRTVYLDIKADKLMRQGNLLLTIGKHSSQSHTCHAS